VESCLEAVTRAFNAFSNRDIFMAMRKSAMARNFDWAQSALSYQQVYGRAIEAYPQRRVA
jgi:glycogen synthase